MKKAVEEINERERKAVAEGKGGKNVHRGEASALYGIAGSLPDKSIVRELAKTFLDTLYKA